MRTRIAIDSASLDRGVSGVPNWARYHQFIENSVGLKPIDDGWFRRLKRQNNLFTAVTIQVAIIEWNRKALVGMMDRVVNGDARSPEWVDAHTLLSVLRSELDVLQSVAAKVRNQVAIVAHSCSSAFERDRTLDFLQDNLKSYVYCRICSAECEGGPTMRDVDVIDRDGVRVSTVFVCGFCRSEIENSRHYDGEVLF